MTDPMPTINAHSLRILKEPALPMNAFDALMEMEKRIDEVSISDPLVNKVFAMMRHAQMNDGIPMLAEYRYLLLAYHALIGKLEVEGQRFKDLSTRMDIAVPHDPPP